jgi:hypothetical protein
MVIAQGRGAAVWMLVAGLAVASAGGPVVAADVEIAADRGAIDLDAESGDTVHIATGVTVSGEITATTQAWTLTNDGAVQPPGFANAIAFSAGGAVHNAAGAAISAGYSAIILGNAGAGAGLVENAGTITGGAFGDAVQLYGGGTVTNLTGAEISSTSSSNAVSISGGTSRSVFNYGTISNTGGTWATGVLIQGAAGSITNATGGAIFGTYNGVYTSGTAPLTLVNAGSITSTNGPAVEARGGGTFTNSGMISSGNDGMFVAGAATVTNSGTLASTGSGRAIAFSGGEEHTLILDTGSVLTGNAQGGSGTDNLVLRGTGTESIDKFLSFETLAMQGVDWTLAGIGTFATSASIDSGRLAVGGTLTTGALSILSGGVLGGSGHVAGATANAGTIAPGDSIGTLTVDSVLFSPNAMLEIEIDPLTSDRLIVTGTATISSDAMVRVLPMAGIYGDGFEYLILDAGTGVPRRVRRHHRELGVPRFHPRPRQGCQSGLAHSPQRRGVPGRCGDAEPDRDGGGAGGARARQPDLRRHSRSRRRRGAECVRSRIGRGPRDARRRAGRRLALRPRGGRRSPAPAVRHGVPAGGSRVCRRRGWRGLPPSGPVVAAWANGFASPVPSPATAMRPASTGGSAARSAASTGRSPRVGASALPAACRRPGSMSRTAPRRRGSTRRTSPPTGASRRAPLLSASAAHTRGIRSRRCGMSRSPASPTT